MKIGPVKMECEACKAVETTPTALSKRSFMMKFNRFVRAHRLHEYRAKVGEGKISKPSKGERLKRVLRQMPTYGVTKQ